MSSWPLAYIGRILVLIGGVLLLVLSAFSLLESVLGISFRSALQDLNILSHASGLIPLIIGIICIIISKYVNKLAGAIVLIILGYVGGGTGGLLVLIGGVLGLVSVLMKKT